MRSARFWTGVGLVVLAIALFALNGDAIAEEQQYARDGQLADGLIIGKAIKRSMRAGSRESQTEYAVTYRFTVAGDSFEGEQSLLRDAWDRAREMEPARIEYLAANPSANRMAGHTRGRLPFVLGGVGLIAGVIGMVVSARAIRTARLKV
jgi:Protein of unknown function (DUF3592)